MNALYGDLGDGLYYMEWQYNGNGSFANMIEWCEDMLPKNNWSYRGWETIHFFDKAAYTFFLVRWA